MTVINKKRIRLVPERFIDRVSQEWILEPIRFKVRRSAEVDGRSYALVPLMKQLDSSTALVTYMPFVDERLSRRCGSEVLHYAAIDLETGKLARKTWINAEQPCDLDDKWGREFLFNKKSIPTQISVFKFGSVEQGRAAWALEKQEEEEKARAYQARRDFENRATAAEKRQIGATVCRAHQGVGYAGYTEQVSPDTGKIRIRIVRHFNPATSQFLLNRPHEENIWDDPDNWYVCSF